jgi:RNA polymerase sigma factor (sigma-70 family)
MDAEQYNQCVKSHSDALFRFAFKNLKDRDEANEIVQIAFEKLWLHHAKVDAAKAKSYLFTTAYHAMADLWRKSKRLTEMTPQVEQEKPTSPNEFNGLKQILHNALARLPEIQRTVILLRDYEGYSYEEIGEITHLNESQVKVYIFRGRQTLKTIIGSINAVI